jgi:hypothetical protein
MVRSPIPALSRGTTPPRPAVAPTPPTAPAPPTRSTNTPAGRVIQKPSALTDLRAALASVTLVAAGLFARSRKRR